MSGPDKRILFALDFDRTILAENSDTWIFQLLPSGKLPSELEATYKKNHWTDFMNNVFRYMHQQDITVQQILDCVKGISLAPGMSSLLEQIHHNVDKCGSKSKFLVISDANDLFIPTYLTSLSPPVHPSFVITNKTLVNSNNNNLLQIQPYEDQLSCSICPKNMCKGRAVEKYIEREGPFDVVVYVGDGSNDLCPTLKLSERDFVFPRKGLALEKLVKERESSIIASIHVWEDAESIVDKVSKILK